MGGSLDLSQWSVYIGNERTTSVVLMSQIHPAALSCRIEVPTCVRKWHCDPTLPSSVAVCRFEPRSRGSCLDAPWSSLRRDREMLRRESLARADSQCR